MTAPISILRLFSLSTVLLTDDFVQQDTGRRGSKTFRWDGMVTLCCVAQYWTGKIRFHSGQESVDHCLRN